MASICLYDIDFLYSSSYFFPCGYKCSTLLFSSKTLINSSIQAAKLRFRAVMMTNIAFILGLLPLVFASGAGAASRHSVGITVLGGMVAVAFIGTFLVPAYYVIIEKSKHKIYEYIKKKWGLK